MQSQPLGGARDGPNRGNPVSFQDSIVKRLWNRIFPRVPHGAAVSLSRITFLGDGYSIRKTDIQLDRGRSKDLG